MDVDVDNPPTGHRIPPALLKALNEHANKEMAASQAYLAMAYYFDDMNFEGIAAYFKAQSDEERGHATKMWDFIIKRGDKVAIESLPVPKDEWTSATEAFTSAFALEVATTASIHALFELSKTADTKDPGTEAFLHFYINEQVASEDQARRDMEECRAYDKMPGLLYHLDKFLGKRAKKD
ncbi:ferritin-like superfamily [Hyaloraphidium curvatum]|nr:ferritin-like superfamily [Hyaloraphidium curvatum]